MSDTEQEFHYTASPLALEEFLSSPHSTEYNQTDIDLIIAGCNMGKSRNHHLQMQWLQTYSKKLVALVHKQHPLPGPTLEHLINTLNLHQSVLTATLYAVLGPKGANVIPKERVTVWEKDTTKRLGAVAAVLLFVGLDSPDNEIIVPKEQVTNGIAMLAVQLVKGPSSVLGLCCTNHLYKVLTDTNINTSTDFGTIINNHMGTSIRWDTLLSPNKCESFCDSPLRYMDRLKQTELATSTYPNTWTIRTASEELLALAHRLWDNKITPSQEPDNNETGEKPSQEPATDKTGETPSQEHDTDKTGESPSQEPDTDGMGEKPKNNHPPDEPGTVTQDTEQSVSSENTTKEKDTRHLDNDKSQKTCSICQEECDKYDKVTVLPCTHRFHTSCISTWFKTQPNCPTCREKITNNNRGRSQGEPAPKTVLYPTGAVISTSANRNKDDIEEVLKTRRTRETTPLEDEYSPQTEETELGVMLLNPAHRHSCQRPQRSHRQLRFNRRQSDPQAPKSNNDQTDNTQLFMTLQTLIIAITLLLLIGNVPTTKATSVNADPIQDHRPKTTTGPPRHLQNTMSTVKGIRDKGIDNLIAKIHNAIKRQTWFDAIRTRRNNKQNTTPKPEQRKPRSTDITLKITGLVTPKIEWPVQPSEHTEEIDREIDQELERLIHKHNLYMTRHTNTSNTNHNSYMEQQTNTSKNATSQIKEDKETNTKGHSVSKWLIMSIVVAGITTSCITATALWHLCTTSQSKERSLATPYENNHIYETITYPDDEIIYNYTTNTTTVNSYVPLDPYDHYKTPRSIMGTNTIQHINPTTDSYSIKKRKDLAEQHFEAEWPERRTQFLNLKPKTQETTTRSNMNIYMPMNKKSTTYNLPKSKSANAMVSVPTTALMLTVILSIGTIDTTQSKPQPTEARLQHLQDLQGPTRSQEKIAARTAGDLLLFESYPKSQRPGIVYEKVDVAILDKLQNDINNLFKYAEDLYNPTKTTLLSAEFMCPKYHSTMTETIEEHLKTPFFVDTTENPRNPTRSYTVILTESTKTSKQCTYNLSYKLIHSLLSKHDHTTLAYYYNRQEKYENYRAWLFHRKSRTVPCQDTTDVNRGEISHKHADLQTKIQPHQGGMYSCAELCQNMAQMHAAKQRTSTMCLSGDCNNNTEVTDCNKWSFNWDTKICKITAKRNPSLDKSYYAGHNALTASATCSALEQHSQINILVNNTIREVREICKFNINQLIGTMQVYKSCPGESVELKTKLIPLTTLLTSYRLQLESNLDNEQTHHTQRTTLNLNKLELDRQTRPVRSVKQLHLQKAERTKRAVDNNLEQQVINSLKPRLQNFITTGLTSLATSAQNLFVGSPIAWGVLLIASNLVPLLIQVIIDSEDFNQVEEQSELEDISHKNFKQWNLTKGSNLYTLTPTTLCSRAPLLIENNLPKRIHDLHKLLSNLQQPLYHVLTNSQPLDHYTRSILTNTTSAYGFWTKYIKSKKLIERYYVFSEEGDSYSTQRQLTAIAGRRYSGLVEGTAILGAARLPNQRGPSWSCLEVAYTSESNTTTLPDACYESPDMQQEEIQAFAFLPHAQIIKIFNVHQISHSCPYSAAGRVTTRGIYIALYPKECTLRLNGVEVRPADTSSHSAWKQPHIFINSHTEFAPARHPKYTESLETRMKLIANITTIKQLTKLELSSQEEQQVRYLMDILALTGISATGASIIALAITVLKRYYITILNIDKKNNRSGEIELTDKIKNMQAHHSHKSTHSEQV